MTKHEKQLHDQKLINAYNLRLEQLDQLLSKDLTPFMEIQFTNQRRFVLNRLAKLYNTEKYGLVES